MPFYVAAGAAVVSTVAGALNSPSTPATPDYSAVAQSSVDAAKIQAQTSQAQLDWAKQQYAQQAPLTNAYMQSMVDSTNQQTANAAKDRQRYEQIYQPVEDQFVKQATTWNSPARADQNAGAAMGDVATAMEASRKNSQAQLESYGIDPSQTRYGALDLSTRIAQASSQAAAGTQSRLNTEATGLSLEGEAINIGKGYPGQVAQSYAGATSAGSAGITAGLNTSSVYGNLEGTGTSWGALANSSNSTGTTALNTGFGNAMSAYNANTAATANQAKGIGQLIGAGYMAYQGGL
jgi:hypothetical protein